MTKSAAALYLIPTGLGNDDLINVLSPQVIEQVNKITHFIAENEKTARRFIKQVAPNKSQAKLNFKVLNKFTDPLDIPYFLEACLSGEPMGLMSEAGCPGVADPGAQIVKLAHQKNIQVIPLVGPSSILLAMMASGLNGQNFAFNGYLPIDKGEKKAAIKRLEKHSFEHQQAQVFIETPYRNNKFLDQLLSSLNPNTQLCIACNISTSEEFIKTLPVKEWSKQKVDLHKKPTIFIFQKEHFN